MLLHIQFTANIFHYNSPAIGGSGDLAGAQGSVVGGEVTREGGPDTGDPHGSFCGSAHNTNNKLWIQGKL